MDFQLFISNIKSWANEEQGIESIFLVGSYARNEQKDTSDVDICIITSEKNKFIEHPDFLMRFGVVIKQKIEYWGACTSVRVWYENSFEVEFGFVEASWISQPLDEGTYKVLNDGYQIILDKQGHFENLRL